MVSILLIVVIILCETLSSGFLRLSNILLKRNVVDILLKRNMILSSTCFYDGDDDKEPINDFNGIVKDKLYTLIWYDCYDCNKLLEDVKGSGKDILYINGSYYFFDEKDASNSPLFYKGDYLIAMDLFSIYEELFYDGI